MLTIPAFRSGVPYESLDAVEVAGVRVSMVNAGVIRRDARRVGDAGAALRAMSTHELLAAMARAGEAWRDGALGLGAWQVDLAGWAEAVSTSTGLPVALVRRHGDRLGDLLARQADVLRGLLRGLPVEVLDEGVVTVDAAGAALDVAVVQVARSLGVVLPSNAPSVNGLWLPALPLRLPVALRPGSADPFTPDRLVAALIAGGVPAVAFGIYPSDHEGSTALVEAHDRVMVFGGPEVARRYAHEPKVEVHGPGMSKVVIGRGVDLDEVLDALETSVVYNGGRSCINASTIVCAEGADEVATALAARLARHMPRDLDDPTATLAASANADALSDFVDAHLAGATELSPGPRVIEHGGRRYVRPTVLRCAPDHPLARTELSFPFVAVVELDEARIPAWLGPTLTCTVIGDDALRRAVMARPEVDRVHLGPIPTVAIRWDQPHEGNLFEATWRRRGIAR